VSVSGVWSVRIVAVIAGSAPAPAGSDRLFVFFIVVCFSCFSVSFSGCRSPFSVRGAVCFRVCQILGLAFLQSSGQGRARFLGKGWRGVFRSGCVNLGRQFRRQGRAFVCGGFGVCEALAWWYFRLYLLLCWEHTLPVGTQLALVHT
jgi:hypothetical protein